MGLFTLAIIATFSTFFLEILFICIDSLIFALKIKFHQLFIGTLQDYTVNNRCWAYSMVRHVCIYGSYCCQQFPSFFKFHVQAWSLGHHRIDLVYQLFTKQSHRYFTIQHTWKARRKCHYVYNYATHSWQLDALSSNYKLLIFTVLLMAFAS